MTNCVPGVVWAIHQSDLKSSERLILAELANRANGAGVCWPALLTVAEAVGLSVRAARVAIRRLEGLGKIRIEARSMQTHHYWVLMAADTASPPADSAYPDRQILPPPPPANPAEPPRQNTSDPPAESAANPTKTSNQVRHQVSKKGARARVNAMPHARRSRIDPDWYPTQAGEQFAHEHGVNNLDQQVRKFRDYHTARANLMADWAAAWRTWCGNARRFGQTNEPKFRNGFAALVYDDLQAMGVTFFDDTTPDDDSQVVESIGITDSSQRHRKGGGRA